jgi:hypothetical protein
MAFVSVLGQFTTGKGLNRAGDFSKWIQANARFILQFGIGRAL